MLLRKHQKGREEDVLEGQVAQELRDRKDHARGGEVKGLRDIARYLRDPKVQAASMEDWEKGTVGRILKSSISAGSQGPGNERGGFAEDTGGSRLESSISAGS